MKIAGSRRASAIAVTVGLLVVTLATFAPAILGARRIKAFCLGIAPGTSLVEIQGRADVLGYPIVKVRDGVWMVEHPSSLGRSYCVVNFDASGNATSTRLPD
jgi:hypothetical protein